jgi:hypothetical protein
MPNGNEHLTPESVRLAMDLAWRDHHHARDQTWKGLQMVAVLGAGFITVEVQLHHLFATLIAGGLLVLAALFAIGITKNHRKLERRKFIHIMNCEEWLGLHRDELIPLSVEPGSVDSRDPKIKDGAVKVPEVYSLWQIFNPKEHNSSLFIMRMLIAIIALVVIFIVFRWTIAASILA